MDTHMDTRMNLHVYKHTQ